MSRRSLGEARLAPSLESSKGTDRSLPIHPAPNTRSASALPPPGLPGAGWHAPAGCPAAPSRSRIRAVAFALALVATTAGCVLAPQGALEERARLSEAGAAYAAPVRRLVLPPDPDWRELLRHAFLANGDLEAAYRAWAAAVENIDIAAGYPNTNASVGFEFLFSGDNLKGWDRTSLSLGFDPMQNLSFPTKVLAAGRIAYDEARAAGERFAQAKLDLQSRVLSAWLEYALQAERVHLQRAEVELLELASRSAAARVGTGSAQDDLLVAEIELVRARDRLAALEAMLPQQRARLNALVGRDASLPLAPPTQLPEPRRITASDEELIVAASTTSPALEALAQEVAGRDDALDLARQQYFPDINPFAGITGSMEQVAGAALTLATMIPQIRAGIRQAEQSLHAGEARLRQARGERGTEAIALLIAIRDAERQREVLENQILPLAKLAATNAAQRNATGSDEIAAVIDAERAVLELRRAIAEVRIAREQSLAQLERLTGRDIETFAAGNPMATKAGEGVSS